MRTTMKILELLGLFYAISVYTVDAVPEIQGKPIVVNVHEDRKSDEVLACIDCQSDVGMEVSLIEVAPPSAKCAECFQVYQEDPAAGYCLKYLAGQGSLSYSETDSYNITVRCTDANEDNDTAVVQVRVLTNQIPTFDLTTDTCKQDPFSPETKQGDIIFDGISADDPDKDPLYFSMKTDPVTSNFFIGPGDGIIRAQNTLKVECNPQIKFDISVSDGVNPKLGPKSVTCNFDVYAPPTVSNINKDFKVPEDTAVGTEVLALQLSSTTPPATIEFSTRPLTAYYLFEFVNNKLRVRSALDYEDKERRIINMTIWPDNGFCSPIKHYLNIIITNVNEKPLITPKELPHETYEGLITFKPNFVVTDKDNDTLSYRLRRGLKYFTIDATTGVISSIENYDVDTTFPKEYLLKVQVSDPKGLTDTANLRLRVKDANDNAPVFKKYTVSWSVTECTPGGKKLGSVRAEDTVDSDFELNNDTYIEADSNAYISVTEKGDVYLLKSLPANQPCVLRVYAKDRGLEPGPKQSDKPAVITVSSAACPTKAPTQTNGGTNGGSNGGTNSGGTNTGGTNTGGSSGGNGNAGATTTIPTTTTAPISTIAIGTCQGFFCDTTMILAVVFGGLGALGLLASAVCLISKFCKSCKKSPNSKPKDKTKKTYRKVDKKRGTSPSYSDYRTNSYV